MVLTRKNDPKSIHIMLAVRNPGVYLPMRQSASDIITQVSPLPRRAPHLRLIGLVLLAIGILAALSPLVCAQLCHPSQGRPGVISPSSGLNTRDVLDTPGNPGGPVIPAPLHCAAHHPCCQPGAPLSAIALVTLLLVVWLGPPRTPSAPRSSLAPTTPPPQSIAC